MPAIPLFMAEKPENKLWIYRRRMPHWRLDGSIYFVTWRLYKSQKELTATEREVIVSALKHFEGQRLDLLAYVVMPEHVHVLVKPYQEYLLHELVHSWKSYTVYRLQRDSDRKGRIWQEDYFDRLVRDEPEFIEKMQYILNNPLKIQAHTENYPWVWLTSAFE